MKIIQNPTLSDIFWYKIGGKARFIAEISSRDDLYEALEFAKRRSITKIITAGMGTNYIFSDNFFDGMVLHFIPNSDGIRIENGTILQVFAGQTLDDVIQFGFDHNLIGLQWAGGLPGTVGAAVRGNVRAFGGEIKDVFVKSHCVRILENGEYEELTLTREDMDFSYRTSRVKREKLIVLEAIFELKIVSGDQEMKDAKEIYNRNIDYRKDRHPLEYPNCGSVFKNISDREEVARILSVWPDIKDSVDLKWHGKVSMGYIIGRLGIAGIEVGGAQISEKHHNFIINKNHASSSDVKTIISIIEQKSQETLGFTPEVEVEIVTN